MGQIRLNVTLGDVETGSSSKVYEVPFTEGMSLLDALMWIREYEDPSLSVRYSCRSANACKECMALIDGKGGYLCSIRAIENADVQIEPLKGRPWLKDLTTLME